MKKAPLVSVHMVTYNHEKYIAQAIESVLLQKTKFDFELVIGEDFSDDNTRNIIKTFVLNNPGKINALLHPYNLGLDGKNNSVETLKNCNGKYVALCEGDDFWTDPYKLQKQIDFLEENTDFSICFHNSKIL